MPNSFTYKSSACPLSHWEYRKALNVMFYKGLTSLLLGPTLIFSGGTVNTLSQAKLVSWQILATVF